MLSLSAALRRPSPAAQDVLEPREASLRDALQQAAAVEPRHSSGDTSRLTTPLESSVTESNFESRLIPRWAVDLCKAVKGCVRLQTNRSKGRTKPIHVVLAAFGTNTGYGVSSAANACATFADAILESHLRLVNGNESYMDIGLALRLREALQRRAALDRRELAPAVLARIATHSTRLSDSLSGESVSYLGGGQTPTEGFDSPGFDTRGARGPVSRLGRSPGD